MCTVYTVYTVHCTLYTVHCTLYNVHCTLQTVSCELYRTAASALNTNLVLVIPIRDYHHLFIEAGINRPAEPTERGGAPVFKLGLEGTVLLTKLVLGIWDYSVYRYKAIFSASKPCFTDLLPQQPLWFEENFKETDYTVRNHAQKKSCSHWRLRRFSNKNLYNRCY